MNNIIILLIVILLIRWLFYLTINAVKNSKKPEVVIAKWEQNKIDGLELKTRFNETNQYVWTVKEMNSCKLKILDNYSLLDMPTEYFYNKLKNNDIYEFINNIVSELDKLIRITANFKANYEDIVNPDGYDGTSSERMYLLKQGRKSLTLYVNNEFKSVLIDKLKEHKDLPNFSFIVLSNEINEITSNIHDNLEATYWGFVVEISR